MTQYTLDGLVRLDRLGSALKMVMTELVILSISILIQYQKRNYNTSSILR